MVTCVSSVEIGAPRVSSSVEGHSRTMAYTTEDLDVYLRNKRNGENHVPEKLNCFARRADFDWIDFGVRCDKFHFWRNNVASKPASLLLPI